MGKRFIGRLSPATVIASIALFVSLGGVSYGVATGSIDSREIKNNNIRGKDIRTGTVASSDVADNSLTGGDVVESSLGTVPNATNAGRANTAGSAATASNASSLGGTPAGSHLRGYQVMRPGLILAPTNSPASDAATRTCPAGKKAIGGGGDIRPTDPAGAENLVLTESFPTADGNGWTVTAVETDAYAPNWTVSAYVVCAVVS